MTHDFEVGDHVEWNSEAGRVQGRIKEKITSEIRDFRHGGGTEFWKKGRRLK
jgi:hypothetical protein